MATRAEQHRADEQRQKHAGTPKKSVKPKRAAQDDVRRGDTLKGELVNQGTGSRNLKTAASHQKGGPALESSATGTPSRKSTRRSAGHVKLASNLQRRQVRRTHSPKARAQRAAVR